jgi:hypothetical protein
MKARLDTAAANSYYACPTGLSEGYLFTAAINHYYACWTGLQSDYLYTATAIPFEEIKKSTFQMFFFANIP